VPVHARHRLRDETALSDYRQWHNEVTAPSPNFMKRSESVHKVIDLSVLRLFPQQRLHLLGISCNGSSLIRLYSSLQWITLRRFY
jgi:hypothetical protein